MSVTEPLSPARASLPMDDAVGRVALRKAGWRLIPLLALVVPSLVGAATIVMMRSQSRAVKGPSLLQ
jgi:hypothetical protein